VSVQTLHRTSRSDGPEPILTKDRIGVKPIRSSALTKVQKAKGKGLVNEDALAHFGESAAGMPAYVKRKEQSHSVSPDKGKASVKGKTNGTRASSQMASGSGSGSRAVSPTKKVRPARGKAKEADVDEDSEAESGDEAELLDESQLNELEDIYKRYERVALITMGDGGTEPSLYLLTF
jgi:hypothetical protein